MVATWQLDGERAGQNWSAGSKEWKMAAAGNPVWSQPTDGSRPLLVWLPTSDTWPTPFPLTASWTHRAIVTSLLR